MFLLAEVNTPGHTWTIAGEQHKPYLLVTTGHDGLRSLVCMFTAVRVVCNNTLSAALADGRSIRAQGRAGRFVPVTDAILQKPSPSDWLMWRRTLDGWGYSPLNQIKRNNVAQLRMVWTRGMAPGSTQESTPLVYDGVMYLPNSGDYIQALDAKTGDLIWDYQRQLAEGARRDRNRNIAIYGNTIIDTSIDNYVYALDAETGKLVWETQILDPRKPANASSGQTRRV